MKTILSLLIFCVIAGQSILAQNKALSIDQNGNVGINTETPQTNLDVNGSINVSEQINGVFIMNLVAQNPTGTLDQFGRFYSTLTISHVTSCTGQGISAFALFDPYEKVFKIMAQGGSSGNHVVVDSENKNTLVFNNICGLTVKLTFTVTDNYDVVYKIDKPANLAEAKFNIIAQRPSW